MVSENLNLGGIFLQIFERDCKQLDLVNSLEGDYTRIYSNKENSFKDIQIEDNGDKAKSNVIYYEVSR